MKVLVLVENYPSENSKSLMYVHTRNLYYLKNDINVTVLNFRTKENYTIDGVNVITLDEYKLNKNKYKDCLLIAHAPNLKHHYIFLKKYQKNFKNLVFFFHGHEVLKINKVYSKPYKYMKENGLKKLLQNMYDNAKLYVWRKYYTKIAYKSYFIFVSKWMYDEFLKWTKIKPEVIENKYSITYNGIGREFEKLCYDYAKEKRYDFITIRTNLDGSKYSIDIVNELAKINPEKYFLVVGKGKFFKYNEKAKNLVWVDKVLNHTEIIKLLDESKCALMPTRTDAQGLMMCEMATFGIPLITSDIPVCHEIFDGFKNVALINNEKIKANNLTEIYNKIKDKKEKNNKYFFENTCKEEINILEEVVYGRTNE